jgi:hypothetical protein
MREFNLFLSQFLALSGSIRRTTMKKLCGLSILALHLSGCGFSTFTQRETDPFIGDVFYNLQEQVSIMVTDSSRRLVYEFKNNENRRVYCVDAPPDTSIAASGALGGDVTSTIPSGTPNVNGTGALGGYRTSTTSTIPLIRRSQGLQWERDNATRECMLFAMGIISNNSYLKRLDDIRAKATVIIEKELANLG